MRVESSQTFLKRYIPDRVEGLMIHLRARSMQIWRFLLADPLNLVGSFIVLFVVLLGIFGPLVAPYDPIEPVYSDLLQPPGLAHLFGTDEIGRDLFSRVIHG